MLAYVLALTVGLGSLAIYMAAFFFPEIHRKNDFIWSGVGLFYAWVLWVCAGRITGGLLLGQVASVALLSWSVTQTLSLRRQLTPRLQQTEIPSVQEVKNTVEEKVAGSSLTQKLSQLGKRFGGSATAAKDRLQQSLGGDSQDQSQGVNSRVQIVDKRTPVASVPEVTEASAPDELVQASRESAAVENTQTGEASVVQSPELVAEEEVSATALTEEEAISLAVETTLAEAVGEEDSVSEPVRPHPPDPELVEAAVHDAEAKHLQASPPEVEMKTNRKDAENTEEREIER